MAHLGCPPVPVNVYFTHVEGWYDVALRSAWGAPRGCAARTGYRRGTAGVGVPDVPRLTRLVDLPRPAIIPPFDKVLPV